MGRFPLVTLHAINTPQICETSSIISGSFSGEAMLVNQRGLFIILYSLQFIAGGDIKPLSVYCVVCFMRALHIPAAANLINIYIENLFSQNCTHLGSGYKCRLPLCNQQLTEH